MKNVWVVTAGYDYEGTSLVEVFASKELAENRAKLVEKRFDFTSVAEQPIQENPPMGNRDRFTLYHFLSGMTEELYNTGIMFDGDYDGPHKVGQEVAGAIVRDWLTAPNITIGNYIDAAMEELGIEKPE